MARDDICKRCGIPKNHRKHQRGCPPKKQRASILDRIDPPQRGVKQVRVILK